ncbi:hypothetical protein Zm00014a_020853 [Zea mays]|uniref:Uncharacterized protein n=1 Tax=Zea mays TaxID=4577 RepID=A0A3L6DPW4_MAIZE|nr:hypothetical protein Zm00014a_020853 [Zea mays]
MTATSKAPRRPRIRPRGPPPAPTPIRTARGARTAAADERVLAEFLEASLRVPDLSLPRGSASASRRRRRRRNRTGSLLTPSFLATRTRSSGRLPRQRSPARSA